MHLLLLSFNFVGGAVPRSTLLLAIAGSVSVFIPIQLNGMQMKEKFQNAICLLKSNTGKGNETSTMWPITRSSVLCYRLGTSENNTISS